MGIDPRQYIVFCATLGQKDLDTGASGLFGLYENEFVFVRNYHGKPIF
jgi:hypothetical protein